MTHEINVGGVGIGGNNPVRVQSMCSTKTSDVKATVAQIKELQLAGCELVRVAVPNWDAVEALPSIKKQISIPLIADVHYDASLAIASVPFVDKLRINPGTMPKNKLLELLNACKAKGIPIRIGVNSGSLEKKYAKLPIADRMLASVSETIRLLEENNFKNIIVALKSSDIKTTIEANRKFAEKFDYPLHIGLTEAGFGEIGIMKNAIAIGSLLVDGIGNTIRVSITDNPCDEVKAAWQILNATGIRKKGLTLISCPTCARTSVNLMPYAQEVSTRLSSLDKPVTVAVMGCGVNGPGEAKHADFGLAFSNSRAFLFKKGKIVGEVALDKAVEQLCGLVVQW